MKSVFKFFPAFYPLPFLLSSSQFEAASFIVESARWGVLAIGAGFSVYFGFMRKSLGRNRIRLPDLFILSYVLIFFLSTAWSVLETYTFQRSLSMLLLYLTSFWAFWYYADLFGAEKLIDRVLDTIVIFLALNLLISWFVSDPFIVGRFRGFFENPNNIGIIVCVAGPLALMRLMKRRSVVDFLSVGVLTLNLALSGSRSATLIMVIIISLLGARVFLRKPQLGFFFISVLSAGIWIFSQTAFFNERILREDTIATGSNRVFFWELAEEYIANRPDLGHGFGTDIIVHGHYGVSLDEMGLRGSGVMSSYYGLAIQIGKPLTYLFFGSVWAYFLWALLVRTREFWLYGFAAIACGGLLMGVGEPLLFSAGNPFSYLYWIVIMLFFRAVCEKRSFRHRPRRKPSPAPTQRQTTY